MSSEQRERIRTVYFEKRRNSVDADRLNGLLAAAGFTYIPETQELTWETQEEDFKLFDALILFLQSASSYESESFELKFTAFLKELFVPWQDEGVPVYSDRTQPLLFRLQDPGLPRSEPHKPRTPFDHSLDVLNRMVFTEHLLSGEIANEDELFRMLLAGLLHDIGKVAIAQHDYNHDHGFISALILESYFQDRGILTPTSRAIVSTIRNHHLIELMNFDRQALSYEEGIDLIRLPEEEGEDPVSLPDMLRFQIALSLADSLSVPAYQVFSIFVIRSFYEMYERLSSAEQENLFPFLLQLCEFSRSLIATVEKNQAFSSVPVKTLPDIKQGMLEMSVVASRVLSKHYYRFERVS